VTRAGPKRRFRRKKSGEDTSKKLLFPAKLEENLVATKEWNGPGWVVTSEERLGNHFVLPLLINPVDKLLGLFPVRLFTPETRESDHTKGLSRNFFEFYPRVRRSWQSL
jgi:hypothetical protein